MEWKDKDALSKIIEMIHDEFAFDGYLDDGVEDVNMGEKKSSFLCFSFVISQFLSLIFLVLSSMALKHFESL